ncbi:BadF/BadG/BcrA/BcrD ATPase family protein [Tunturiibacter empetritectus]|uniref:N-acetylglucosamine kinase n=1 Tax=Tunturiibacter empetritectus TaxID=3069691 RepID=UPI003D9B170C
MAFYLALDLGGTKTEYVLADETRELARVRGGTIKRMRTDANTAAQNLDKALAELTALTGVSMRSVTRSCVGAAGITVALVTDWIREAFAERVGGSLVLVGDVEIALDAAFFGGPGVLVMAGTGSNVAGRFLSGDLTTAGGWGPALADQGSGNRIGHQALRDTFFAIDEERTTTLLPAILDLWQLPDLDSLIGYANQIPAPDFTRLAPLVVRCAVEETLWRRTFFSAKQKSWPTLRIWSSSGCGVTHPRAVRDGFPTLRSPGASLNMSRRSGTESFKLCYAGTPP